MGDSDDVIAINYCSLYAKHFIYREKLYNQNEPAIDFFGIPFRSQICIENTKKNIHC